MAFLIDDVHLFLSCLNVDKCDGSPECLASDQALFHSLSKADHSDENQAVSFLNGACLLIAEGKLCVKNSTAISTSGMSEI